MLSITTSLRTFGCCIAAVLILPGLGTPRSAGPQPTPARPALGTAVFPPDPGPPLAVPSGPAIPAGRDIRGPDLAGAVDSIVSRLDQFAPAWQFREVHRRFVEAPPERVYRAIKTVTAREIPFFRALTWLRRLGRRGPVSILNPAPDRPLLEVATESGFLLLVDEPGREVVVGTVVIAPPGAARSVTAEQYRKLAGSGWAKGTMNFLIEQRGAGCS